jgi:hypothetical protein
VVSFTPLPLYLLDRRLGGPQNRSGRREEKIVDHTGTRTPTPLLRVAYVNNLHTIWVYLAEHLLYKIK